MDAPIFKIDTKSNVITTFKIYDLVKETDPILGEPTKHFDFKDPPMDPVYLASSLFETMFKNKGLGLSANQIGIPYRVFTVGFDNTNKQVFFNAEIIEQSDETESAVEGCLSYPLLFLKVKRPIRIKIKYQHANGVSKEDIYEGLTARVIAHEIAHMEGKLFIDSVGPASLIMARDKRRKLLKKMNRK